MTDADLIMALESAPTPRPDPVVRAVTRRLFPLWQAFVVGVPIALAIGVVGGTMLAAIIEEAARTPVFSSWLMTASLALGIAIGAALVARWMYGRRRAFAMLARNGQLVPTYIVSMPAASTIGGALGSALAEAWNWPIVGAAVDGHVVEVRTSRHTAFDASGNVCAPRLMLVDRSTTFVALIQAHTIGPQRVLRSTPDGWGQP